VLELMGTNERLKAIIVEDEEPIRNLLRISVDWEKLGVTIEGEASNAYEALDLVDCVYPDIMFTDICMPIIDGIELSRMVVEKYPNIKIIILTGHDDFEFAKKSIKVGISDFLLKPIDGEEISNAVLKIKAKILEEKSNQKEKNRLRKLLDENLPFLREKALNEILSNALDAEKIKKILNFYTIDLTESLLQIAVIETMKGDENAETSHLLLNLRCQELIRQYFKENEKVHIFSDVGYRIVILNNNVNVDLSTCVREILTILINQCKAFVSIGLGNPYQTLTRLRHSYVEACMALKYKIVSGWNLVICYSDMNLTQDGRVSYDVDMFETLRFNIHVGLKDKAVAQLENILGENGEAVTPDTLRIIGSNVISAALGALNDHGITISEVFQEGYQIYEKIFKIDNVPEMRRCLNEILENSIESINRASKFRKKNLVGGIEEYIKKNYRNSELSLSLTAKEFYVNPSYLSRVFKENTGMNFIEYVTRVRIEAAMKLLKSTDKKVYQIADEVGISDPKYFSVCFKKTSGLSVSDYRNQ